MLLPASAGAQAVDEEDKARGRPAVTSSSHEPGEYPFSAACALRACAPKRAVDRDRATRWALERADGQWWQVDLGAVRLVDPVRTDACARFGRSRRAGAPAAERQCSGSR